MIVESRSHADSRARALRWRTIATGALVALLGAAGLLAALLTAIDLWRVFFMAADTVPLHVPRSVGDVNVPPYLTWAFYGLCAVSVWGLSNGRLRRVHGRAALLLTVMVALADWWYAAPLHKPLFLLPSRFERLVTSERFDEAARLVDEHARAAGAAKASYLHAQIALRANDGATLATAGMPLLTVVDDLTYRVSPDPLATAVLEDMYGDMRLDVLGAIDRRLHGAAVSAAGLADQSSLDRLSAGEAAARAARHSLVALSAMLLGGLLFRIWRRMRANVMRIDELLGRNVG